MAGGFSDLVTGIGGAVSSLFGAEGNAAQAKDFNAAAQLANQNAQLAAASTRIQETQITRQVSQSLGKTEADVAGAGFTESGSALDLLRSSAQQGALAKSLVNIQGTINENSYAAQAGAYSGEAKAATAASTAGTIGAIASAAGALISGAGAIAGAFSPGGVLSSTGTLASGAKSAFDFLTGSVPAVGSIDSVSNTVMGPFQQTGDIMGPFPATGEAYGPVFQSTTGQSIQQGADLTTQLGSTGISAGGDAALNSTPLATRISDLLNPANLALQAGNILGGIGGTFIGTAISKSVGGGNPIGSNVGGAIGGVAGSFAIPIPILGTFIGSTVGSIIGGMFGNNAVPTQDAGGGGFLMPNGMIQYTAGGSKNGQAVAGFPQASIEGFSSLASAASASLGIQFNPGVGITSSISTAHPGPIMTTGPTNQAQVDAYAPVASALAAANIPSGINVMRVLSGSVRDPAKALEDAVIQQGKGTRFQIDSNTAQTLKAAIDTYNSAASTSGWGADPNPSYASGTAQIAVNGPGGQSQQYFFNPNNSSTVQAAYLAALTTAAQYSGSAVSAAQIASWYHSKQVMANG